MSVPFTTWFGCDADDLDLQMGRVGDVYLEHKWTGAWDLSFFLLLV